jgi:hypothetical protein
LKDKDVQAYLERKEKDAKARGKGKNAKAAGKKKEQRDAGKKKLEQELNKWTETPEKQRAAENVRRQMQYCINFAFLKKTLSDNLKYQQLLNDKDVQAYLEGKEEYAIHHALELQRCDTARALLTDATVIDAQIKTTEQLLEDNVVLTQVARNAFPTIADHIEHARRELEWLMEYDQKKILGFVETEKNVQTLSMEDIFGNNTKEDDILLIQKQTDSIDELLSEKIEDFGYFNVNRGYLARYGKNIVILEKWQTTHGIWIYKVKITGETEGLRWLLDGIIFV